jgi:nucleoside-diphosphate-sugar epimerase
LEYKTFDKDLIRYFDKKKMNILITGIHGFVGSNITIALKTKHNLYGLDIVSPEKSGVINTFSWNELSQLSDIPIDAIIHLAGKAHDTKNQSEASSYFEINTELTRTIYNYFLQSSAKTFIYFSSVKAAADRVEGVLLTEEVIPEPVGPYGESKIAAENLILEKLPADKKVIILRPCMIHGPGNKGNLNLLYSVVRKGLPWPLGAYENRRSFTSIDNLTVVVEKILTQHIPSGIYNIGDDEALSTNELIELICEVLGKKARIWKISPLLMYTASKCGGALRLPLNPERLRKLTENYVVSNVKIKQALGMDKMPVKAREGLIKTIKSFEN